MEIRSIEPTDINEINSWLAYRSSDQQDVDMLSLPPTGWIVPGIACVYYSITNGKVLWVENGVSNPRAELSERRRAGELFAAMFYRIIRENKLTKLRFLTRVDVVHEFYGKLVGAKRVGTFDLYQADYHWSEDREAGGT